MWADDLDEDPDDAELTFDDLVIDDTLSDLERVTKFASSSIALQRLVHVRLVADTARGVGFAPASVGGLFDVLEAYAQDGEAVVRRHLAEQIGLLVCWCCGAHDGNQSGSTVHSEDQLMVARATTEHVQTRQATNRTNVTDETNETDEESIATKATHSQKSDTSAISEEAYDKALSLLPLLGRLLMDEDETVRQAAVESIMDLTPHVRVDDRMERVLSLALECANEQERDELRATAAALLNRLSLSMPQEICQQFIVPVVISLSEDPAFRVRKAAALNLDKVFAACEPSVREQRLLPAFLRMTNDPIWGVRKACTERLLSVATNLSPQQVTNYLVPFALAAAEDESMWVRGALYQNLGAFLSALPGQHISDKLLRMFLDMGIANSVAPDDDGDDFELSFHCAFSFPAVVLAIGPDRWNQEITAGISEDGPLSSVEHTFHRLVRDVRWRVRRTLACSLHEVAKVIGPERSENSLLSTFDLFLKDLDEVKLGVVSHLADFIECLPPDCRETYLPVVQEVQANSSPLQWRFRLMIAQQLPALARIFSPESTFSGVTSIAFAAADDDVSAIRAAAFAAFPTLLQRLAAHNAEWPRHVLARVSKWASARSCTLRQRFVMLCADLSRSAALDRALFEQVLLPALVQVGNADPVATLRISFAVAVRQSEWLNKHESTAAVVEQLLDHHDRDVALSAGATEEHWWQLHGRAQAEALKAAALEEDKLRLKPQQMGGRNTPKGSGENGDDVEDDDDNDDGRIDTNGYNAEEVVRAALGR